MGDKAIHLVMWIFVGAIVVLIVTHAAGFAQSVNAVGGQVTNDASLLAGYAPATAGGSTSSLTSNQGGMYSSGSPSVTLV
jgi:hypothetical protein